MKYYFPCLQIFVCLGASIIYACYGDWRRSLYWLFAAGLTVTVTF